MQERYKNELDNPEESTFKRTLLSFARDDIDTVINYVGSTTNRELQANYESLKGPIHPKGPQTP